MPCFKCDLNFNRTNELEGVGNPNAKIAFLINYPQPYESKKGISFSNKAYTKFFNDLRNIGITKDNAYFTYLLKCPIDSVNGELYKDYEIRTKHCAYNNLELKTLPNLKIIVTVGKFASSFVISDYYPNVITSKIINTHITIGKFIFYFMYHPIYLKNNTHDNNDYEKLLDVYRKVNPYHIIDV